ncbi:MAG: hypothetical protein U1A27_09195 [Phycisphaerae bacterium]
MPRYRLEVQDTALCFELGRATVVVPEDQLSLAIGSWVGRTCGWRGAADGLGHRGYSDSEGVQQGASNVLASTLRSVPGVEEVVAEKITLLGSLTSTWKRSAPSRWCRTKLG